LSSLLSLSSLASRLPRRLPRSHLQLVEEERQRVDLDAGTGLRWARLLAELRTSGRSMPLKDSLIAATALVHGIAVVTWNRRGFEKAGARSSIRFNDRGQSVFHQAEVYEVDGLTNYYWSKPSKFGAFHSEKTRVGERNWEWKRGSFRRSFAGLRVETRGRCEESSACRRFPHDAGETLESIAPIGLRRLQSRRLGS